MKISKNQLQKIIAEEIQKYLQEAVKPEKGEKKPVLYPPTQSYTDDILKMKPIHKHPTVGKARPKKEKKSFSIDLMKIADTVVSLAWRAGDRALDRFDVGNQIFKGIGLARQGKTNKAGVNIFASILKAIIPIMSDEEARRISKGMVYTPEWKDPNWCKKNPDKCA